MVLDTLETNEDIKEIEAPLKCEVTHGAIEFDNVSFTYDKNMNEDEKRYIFNNLSFKIEAGKSTALVGSTGSGKSTIMRLLYRFYDIDAKNGIKGAIKIDG